MIILDDFDIQYKTIGVGMVHTMITRMSPSCIIKSHLDNVFLEVENMDLFAEERLTSIQSHCLVVYLI